MWDDWWPRPPDKPRCSCQAGCSSQEVLAQEARQGPAFSGQPLLHHTPDTEGLGPAGKLAHRGPWAPGPSSMQSSWLGGPIPALVTLLPWPGGSAMRTASSGQEPSAQSLQSSEWRPPWRLTVRREAGQRAPRQVWGALHLVPQPCAGSEHPAAASTLLPQGCPLWGGSPYILLEPEGRGQRATPGGLILGTEEPGVPGVENQSAMQV